MKNTVLVDLDGTLANIDHRLKYLESKPKDYDSFYAELKNDKVNEWCKEFMLAMNEAGHEVLIVSARPKDMYDATLQWVKDNFIEYPYGNLWVPDIYLLREPGQHQIKDSDLKEAWVKEYGLDKILFVVEDRTRVVRMYRNLGLTCLQCDDWGDK